MKTNKDNVLDILDYLKTLIEGGKEIGKMTYNEDIRTIERPSEEFEGLTEPDKFKKYVSFSITLV